MNKPKNRVAIFRGNVGFQYTYGSMVGNDCLLTARLRYSCGAGGAVSSA
jgi:hypothetical protein